MELHVLRQVAAERVFRRLHHEAPVRRLPLELLSLYGHKLQLLRQRLDLRLRRLRERGRRAAAHPTEPSVVC
jgi:hypothetical protein